MACPYCGSGEWIQFDALDMCEDGWKYVAVYRSSHCLDCNKDFVTKSWYIDDNTCECMTTEEYEGE